MVSPTLLFLHIPNTAATTLNSIIERQYVPAQIYALGKIVQKSLTAYCQMSTAEKQRHRLITDHTDFGLHEHLPSPSRYFTLLLRPWQMICRFSARACLGQEMGWERVE